MRKIGVEEELLLIDPDTLMLKPVSERAIRLHEPDDSEQDLQTELFLQQIESATEPCDDVEGLIAALRAARRTASKAARDAGAAAIAVGTPALWDSEGDVTPDDRYRRMLRTYGEIGRQSLVCGMHVHVDVASDDEAVGVIDHIRPWIPVLMAVAVNTPFHQGIDTGYASWRSHVWGAWPSAGPVEPFGGFFRYRAVIDDMVGFADWRVDQLRAARWRASRYGLTEQLIDPAKREPRPAADTMRSLVRYVADALEETGDGPYVTHNIDRLIAGGSGADRQRAVASTYGRLSAVVEDLLRRTGPNNDSADGE